MPTSKTEKLSTNNLTIILALLSLLAIGATVLVARAQIIVIVRDTKVVKAQSKADENLKKDLAAAPQLVAAYSQLGSTAALVSDALPNTVDFPALIVALENMSVESGVVLKTVTTTGVPAAAETSKVGASTVGVPKTYNFGIDLDGSYTTISKLLTTIELSARPMRVNAVRFSGSGGSLSTSIDAETYYQDKAVLPFSKEIIK